MTAVPGNSPSTAGPRSWQSLKAIAIPVATVIATLAIGLALIGLTGASIPDAIDAFIEGTFGSGYVIAASINRAVAYALVALGFIVAARANLTNVGGEGQIAIGGMTATALALYGGVKGLPLGLAFILPMLAAIFTGALWGGLAGFLKVKSGTNEVISTLLLTFIGIWMLYGSVESVDLLRRPMTTTATLPESLEIPDATKLPLLTGDPSAPLNIGLPIAIVLAGLVWLVLTRSVFGWRLRAVGLNELASRRAGIPYNSTIVAAMAIAGGFGGLTGAIMLQGDQFVLKSGFSSGYGFDGLVIGLLARGSTAGVIAASLLFGFLRSGGINMEMEAQVPSAIVMVIQGMIVVTIAGIAFWSERGKASR